MKSLHIYGLLLILAVPGTVGSLLFSNSTAAQMTPYGAQEMPPANNAARAPITEGPTLEYNQLNQMAKSHIRLNRNHSYTVFRVRMEDLKPGTTYYYTVDSMGGDGTRDGVESTVYHFTTPADLQE